MPRPSLTRDTIQDLMNCLEEALNGNVQPNRFRYSLENARKALRTPNR
jgi:hypothetical protein